jgi:glucose/mannose-6-phosphate isomerase
VAARWWKEEINRNAKAPSFASDLADVTNGELSGWGQSGDVTRQVMTLVLLRHAGEPPGAAAQFSAVKAATDEVMADVLEIEAVGDDDLGRFFDLALLGEMVSLRLAAHEGVDPGPTPALDDAPVGPPVTRPDPT